MDIHQWLQETAGTAQPSVPAPANFPAFSYADRDAATPKRRTVHKRKHKRDSTDSSIMEMAQIPPHAHQSRKRKAREPSPEEATSSGLSYSTSQSMTVSESEHEPQGKTYERRPRHRTKADKYEPKSKRQKRKNHKEDEPKKRKRKSTKRRGSNPTAGLVRNYHAKNVSKNRLTLNPKDSIGIFKKGHASVPVRGQGLPDLVFSEMNFLQKRDRPTAEPEKDEQASKKKKNRKDRKIAQEEEISAYFGTRKKTTEPNDDGSQPAKKTSRPSSLPSGREHLGQRYGQESVESIVDLPGKPFLGFGSRGIRPHGTSLLSRSGSIHAVPSSSKLFRNATVSTEHPGNVREGLPHRRTISVASSLHSRPTARRPQPTAIETSRHPQRVSEASHVRVKSTVVPVEHMDWTVDEMPRQARSKSPSISPGHVDAAEQERKGPLPSRLPGTERPQSRQPPPARPASQWNDGNGQPPIPNNQRENLDPKTSSSPMGKLLYRCAAAVMSKSPIEMPQMLPDPTWQQRRLSETVEPVPDQTAWVGSDYDDRRPYGQRVHWQDLIHDTQPSVSYDQTAPVEYDDYQGAALDSIYEEPPVNDTVPTEEIVLEKEQAWQEEPLNHPARYDQSYVDMAYNEEGIQEDSSYDLEEPNFVQGPEMVEEEPDGLAGFWRPNKLY